MQSLAAKCISEALVKGGIEAYAIEGYVGHGPVRAWTWAVLLVRAAHVPRALALRPELKEHKAEPLRTGIAYF